MNTANWRAEVIATPMQQRQQAMRENHQALLENNFWGLLDERRGEYVLMRSKQIVSFFKEPYDALDQAMNIYPNDFAYSVEKIEDSAVFMGMYVGLVANT
jgi:hypothetical protein